MSLIILEAISRCSTTVYGVFAEVLLRKAATLHDSGMSLLFRKDITLPEKSLEADLVVQMFLSAQPK